MAAIPDTLGAHDSLAGQRQTRKHLTDTLDSRLAAEEAAAREEIKEAFSLIRKLPARQIAVPTVALRHGYMRVASVTLEHAVSDLMSEGYTKDALIAVLQASDCPLVQKLRDALCAEWVRQNALDIAELRA